MIDLERRLQHAARELRAVEIEPPPFESLTAPRRPSGITGRIPALVMPVLFVIGGLAIVAGGMGREAEQPAATISAEVEPPVRGDDDAAASSGELTVSAPALTARQEIALISSLAPALPRSVAETPPVAPVVDADSLSRRYR